MVFLYFIREVKNFICQVITVNRVLNKEKGYLYMATKVVTQMACKIGAEPWALEIPFKGAMVVG